jgi:hypothetical protein
VPSGRAIGTATEVAESVLEDIHLVVAIAHQIGAGDVTPDSPWGIDSVALGTKEGGRADDFFRDDSVLQNFLLVIDVVDEFVESVNTLLEPALNPFPFFGANDARDQVEGENPLRSGGFTVDVEGDAKQQERLFRGILAALQLTFFERLNGIKRMRLSNHTVDGDSVG